MNVIVKILGKLIGGILYPFFQILFWIVAFVCVIVEEIEKLMEEDI